MKIIEPTIEYMQKLLPLILSQILSNSFHIRTFVEAILIKLYLKQYIIKVKKKKKEKTIFVYNNNNNN